MPLTANFLADFSSFLDATKSSIAATKDFEAAAAGVGPTLDRSLGQVGASVDENAAKMEKMGRGIGVALASQELRNLAGDVQNFASTYINEFAEAEAATARMTTALKASGETSPAVAEAFGQMATELQRFSTFSDEAITDAQTILTTVGNIKPNAMEATLKATMDLAKGLGIDLPAATTLMAKAASSDGEALGKLGVVLGKSIDPAKGFAGVMEAVNDKFGGQAAAAMETTAGKMENLNNQMSDINETVGGALASNLSALLGIFQSLPEGVQTFALAVIGIGTALAPVLVSLGSLVSLLGTAGLGAPIVAAFQAILPFLGPVGWIAAGVLAVVAVWKNWDTITGYIKAVYDGLKTYLVDRFAAIMSTVKGYVENVAGYFKWLKDVTVGHSYVPDMIREIGRNFDSLDSVMVKPVEANLSHVAGLFKKYTAMYSGNFTGGAIGGGPAKDFMSYAMQMFPGLTPQGVMQGLAQGKAVGAGFAGASGPAPTVNITMNGMFGADDPQTRASVRAVVSDALMEGMRGSRLMGTS